MNENDTWKNRYVNERIIKMFWIWYYSNLSRKYTQIASGWRCFRSKSKSDIYQATIRSTLFTRHLKIKCFKRFSTHRVRENQNCDSSIAEKLCSPQTWPSASFQPLPRAFLQPCWMALRPGVTAVAWTDLSYLVHESWLRFLRDYYNYTILQNIKIT